MKYRIVEYYGGFEVQVKYKIRWYPIDIPIAITPVAAVPGSTVTFPAVIVANENHTKSNTIEEALEILNDHRKKYDTTIITVYKTDIKDIKGRKTNE